MGESTQPADRNFALERMASDLRSVLALAHGQSVVLIGHSIGGLIFPGRSGARHACDAPLGCNACLAAGEYSRVDHRGTTGHNNTSERQPINAAHDSARGIEGGRPLRSLRLARANDAYDEAVALFASTALKR